MFLHPRLNKKEKMEKLVVMDFSDSSVNIYNINDSDERTPEEIVEELGHNMDECSIMWCKKLSINLND